MAIRTAVQQLLRRAIARPAPPPAPRAPVAPEPEVAPEPPLEVEEPVPGSVLLDIREPSEMAGGVAEGAVLLPMDCVPHQLERLDPTVPITVYCAAGARSLGVAHYLREYGYRAVSLESGIQALRWSRAPMRTPTGAGQRVPLVPGATLDGVPIVEGVLERVDGDLVRVTDATGLQRVGVLGP